MKKRTLVLVSGVVLTAGVIAALAAPPGGPRGDRWGGPDSEMMGPEGGRRGGMRGWFGPRSITADEYDTRTRERFARLDKNGDGVIDSAEIEAGMATLGQRRKGHGAEGRSGSDVERMLKRFGDKDGKITKDAFLAEAKRRFQQFDLNNDGKITDDDLPPMSRGKGMLKANGPVDVGPHGHMLMELRKADTKQDGIITLDAYLAVETKRFEEWDRNKDGVIDKADLDLTRKEMQAYQVKRFLHAYGADADGKVTKDQYYKIAKERFARLDRKGEGRISFGGEERGAGSDGKWFGGRRGAQPGGDMPPIPPKN